MHYADISTYLSCEYLELQARLDNFGLQRTNSITSIAGSINTKKAYKKFCKGLFDIGVTKEMIGEKEEEIRNIFNPQNTATSGQIGGSTIADQSKLPAVSDSTGADQSQLPAVSDSSSVENFFIFFK